MKPEVSSGRKKNISVYSYLCNNLAFDQLFAIVAIYTGADRERFRKTNKQTAVVVEWMRGFSVRPYIQIYCILFHNIYEVRRFIEAG